VPIQVPEMSGQQNQISVALWPVQQPSSSRAHVPNPPAENLARKIVAWVVASVVGQKTEGRGPWELVSVQELVLETEVLVRLAPP
jgi:hypothetical protein